MRRDLSLVVAESIRYAKIQELVQSVAPAHLEELEYVTTYRGRPLEAGQKSITIALVFRSPQETLTSEQVESSVQAVIAAAKEQLALHCEFEARSSCCRSDIFL